MISSISNRPLRLGVARPGCGPARVCLLVLCLLLSAFAYSQHRETTYEAEAFGAFSTGRNVPFWMLYHNWGKVPLDANSFYFSGAVFHKQQISSTWSFQAGLEMAASSPHAFGTVWVQQAYGEVNWRVFQLKIGSKEDYTSLLDENLSSGDFNASNNARPVPEIRLNLNRFCPVPYTKGRMYVKGDFAVGKYLDGKWQEDIASPHYRQYLTDVLSHHKSLYFRFGDIERKDRLQFTFGFSHHAQWGGNIHYRMTGGQGVPYYKTGRQPHSLGDFLRVMVAREGGSGSSGSDTLYVAGSQTGNYLFKFDYKLRSSGFLHLYYQHFFDDGSGMGPESLRDMLLGMQYRTTEKRLLSNAVLEYVYTKKQTGPIHFNLMMDDAHDDIRNKGNGNDNYYNNFDYLQGPSHYGRTMGTPLFLSPEYNRDGYLDFKSNRIIAFHLGIEGYFHPALSYRLLATTGQTWGRYYVPFVAVRDGFASNVDLTYTCPQLKDLDFKLSIGFNTGKFFDENAFGAGITVTKRGVIGIKD
jgi:hypothetical protein